MEYVLYKISGFLISILQAQKEAGVEDVVISSNDGILGSYIGACIILYHILLILYYCDY